MLRTSNNTILTGRTVLALAFAIGQMSCSSLQRNPSSGYRNFQDSDAKEVSAYETPLRSRSPSRIRKSEIEVLESGLRTEADAEYYNQAKPILKNEQDRKEFLNQPGRDSQRRWLASRGVSEASLYDPSVQRAIDEGDVIMDMSKDAVLKSWGDPDAIEVAGNPDYGNERWVYNHYEGMPDGYQKQERVIYFRRGKVKGWETH